MSDNLPRLDQMLVARRITLGQWLVAMEYRHLWASARRRAVPGGSARGVSPGYGGGGTRAVVVLDQLAKLLEVERAIGDYQTRILRAALVEELSWRAIGRAAGLNHETAEAHAIVAVAALAKAWWPPQARDHLHAAPARPPFSAPSQGARVEVSQ
jgi:hypothetical protein